MTATTQPGITLTELSQQIDSTRLDATIEWVRHKIHCVDPIDRPYYETILASLIRLREIEGKLRDAICPHCANTGCVEGGPVAVCCNRPYPNGECCGSPEPERTQEQCQWCAERSALHEYGQAVRDRDASLCDELCEQETMSKHVNKENCRAARSAMDKCAAAISKEPLP